ncbi:MAG: LamG-like jellyroll fold domain-containing protein, partial [Armatimonadota bacterium]|nr:LamG-like jellyroll fold domain-containing protein [Armatimonadota bacterium]
MPRRVLLLAILACLPLLTVPPACFADVVPEGLLYCAHFDTYAAASWAVGSRAPTMLVPAERLVEGRFGRALSLRGNVPYSLVADDGNFRPDRGTVQMWVRPQWDGDDGQVHALFGAHVERGNYLNLTKLEDNTLGVATGGAGVGSYIRVQTDISQWQAGDWHHVAFTWGDGKLALFIDGEQIGEREESIPPRRAPAAITIGASLAGDVDELAIWSVRRTEFSLTEPLPAPELEEPEAMYTIPPPVGEIDRYQFELPEAERGYHVAPKHFEDEVDPAQRPEVLPEQPVLSTFGARGEWRALGMVIYATRDLQELQFTATDLSGPAGATIPADDVQVRLNRRVMQLPRPRVGDEERVPAAALLDPARPFDLPAGHFKEVTVTVHVPEEAPAGDYSGALTISCEDGGELAVPIELEVLPFALEPSERKAFGMYYLMTVDAAEEKRVRAELQDMRDHHVRRMFTWVRLQHEERDGEIVTSYDQVARTLELLREYGFHGEIIFRDGFAQLARLLGHEDVEEGDRGESLAEDERFYEAAERAIRGLKALQEQYPEFEIVLTHMDEVMGRKRRYLYIELARPIRQVPQQRIYITMHTIPADYVPEATAELDPWMDIRGYNGHALDLWIQAGHSWEELAGVLEESGDEGWFYYNPHRAWYTAKWSRIINGLYFHRTPLTVHCPYRYRTMRTWPLSFIHNMAYTVMAPEDLVTPIATRNWEGFRLGAQDAWYLCMLEGLVAQAQQRDIDAEAAKAWLAQVRDLV